MGSEGHQNDGTETFLAHSSLRFQKFGSKSLGMCTSCLSLVIFRGKSKSTYGLSKTCFIRTVRTIVIVKGEFKTGVDWMPDWMKPWIWSSFKWMEMRLIGDLGNEIVKYVFREFGLVLLIFELFNWLKLTFSERMFLPRTGSCLLYILTSSHCISSEWFHFLLYNTGEVVNK